MDIKDLRCFVAVATHLSFSRAAESIYISQPTLSLRIQALEAELNAPLFSRTRKSVYLTSAGAAILPVARRILEQIDALPDLAQEAKDTEPQSSAIVIGFDRAEDRSTMRPFQEVMSGLHKDLPGINVAIVATDYDSYEEKLLDSTIDACFMVFLQRDILHKDFLTTPLFREPLVLAASYAENMTKEDVLRTRDILLLQSEIHQRWNDIYIRDLKEITSDPVSFVYVEPSTIVPNLMYSDTAAILPQSYAEQIGGDDIRLFPLPIDTVTLTLVWNRNNMNHALQYLINEVKSKNAKYIRTNW